MKAYYFANYRLLIDDEISDIDKMSYLAGFSKDMTATHTFILHLGDEALLDAKYAEAILQPVVCTTDRFDIYDTQDSWTIVPLMDENTIKYHGKYEGLE